MHTSKISTPRPLTSGVPIHCPACKESLAELSQDGVTVSTPDTYLADDADAIPDAPREMLGMASIALAGVGQCPGCSTPFWTLELHLDPGGESALIDYLAEDYPWEATYVVDGDLGFRWSIHRYAGEASKGWSHFIGPFSVPPGAATHGRNGVSSCGGGPFWKHAKSVLDKLMPRIEAVQSQL